MNSEEKQIDKPRTKRSTLVSFLKFLLAVIAIYLVTSPFLPAAESLFNQSFDDTKGYKYTSKMALTQLEDLKIKVQDLKPIPKENTLVVPKIGVDTRMHEGESATVLNKGIWRRPNGSTPDQGGNTVLAAHRYMYTSGPNTFYHLDKMAIGDKIILFWEGKEYDYEVDEIKEVPASAVEIENNTKDPIVTLYTCSPLFSSKNRLVVTAKLIDT